MPRQQRHGKDVASAARSVRLQRQRQEAARQRAAGAEAVHAGSLRHTAVPCAQQSSAEAMRRGNRGVETVLPLGEGVARLASTGSASAQGSQRLRTVRCAQWSSLLLLLLLQDSACGFHLPALDFDFKGFRTSYVVKRGSSAAGSAADPVVLVHGFGGSAGQWRATIDDLSASGRTVYALDLIGFGASPKADVDYSIELWALQLTEFIQRVVMGEDGAASAVVVGNSIGSLVCVCAAAGGAAAGPAAAGPAAAGGGPAAAAPCISGLGLMNCAIGMNSKAAPLPTDPPAYAIFFAIAKPLLPRSIKLATPFSDAQHSPSCPKIALITTTHRLEGPNRWSQ